MTSRIRSRRAIALVLALIAVFLVPLAAQADGLSGRDLNTQRNFHLTTKLELCFDIDAGASSVEVECVGQETQRKIFGNLFTFTHPDTPSEAEITSMAYEILATEDHPGRLTGEFTIDVALLPAPRLRWMALLPIRRYRRRDPRLLQLEGRVCRESGSR